MKRLILSLLLIISLCIPTTSCWAGADQLWRAFQPERSPVDGKLYLSPVQISFEEADYFAFAVFAERNRPNLIKNNKLSFEQANAAYFKGLKVEIKNTGNGPMEVYLDYSNCGEELNRLKAKTEKDEVIEGTAAAILLTDGIQTVTLHIKGFYDDKKEVVKSFAWNKLKKRWKLRSGWWPDISKDKLQ